VDGVDGSKRAQQTMECRGCVFSPEGNFIFSIQSAKRGPSHVIKWLIDNDNENKDSTFKVIPLGVIAGGKVPLTKLRISSSGLYVATGGSDGLITIYDVLKAKKMIAFPNHDLPVTGMSFAPTSIISAFKCNDVLVSCSADNRLATVRLQNPSTIFIWIVLMIVVIIMIYVYTNLLPIS
jgi:WD40 repeat protein